jgi:serine/threonine-protein kinase HipA
MLHRDREGRTRFTPDPYWLERNQRPPLGFAFLSNPEPRIARTGLPLWFENLLPEKDSALRQRICQQYGIRETDSAQLLLALGRDLPGAVQVTGDVDTIREEEEEIVSTAAPGKIRFSLAGMQLKFSMLQSGERLALPARGETGRWIVKLPGSRFHELPEVEATTMAWARATGLPIPRNQVLPIEALYGIEPDLVELGFASRHVFAIERFDRTLDGSRIHQEDFAQALEIDPRHKYAEEGPRRTSYDGLARLVKDACGQEVQNDFVDRLAFIVASGNEDAHLKNWTFQWGKEKRPWLSPCYDLVMTISWPEFGWQRAGGPRLALALGCTRRLAELHRDEIKRFSKRANAPDGEARFLAALEKARIAWLTVVDHAPQRMRNAIEEHWRRVPLLRNLGLPAKNR